MKIHKFLQRIFKELGKLSERMQKWGLFRGTRKYRALTPKHQSSDMHDYLRVLIERLKEKKEFT